MVSSLDDLGVPPPSWEEWKVPGGAAIMQNLEFLWTPQKPV